MRYVIGSTSMSDNKKNTLLLFGDYGTEVIRLSQLYDPANCLYQPVDVSEPFDQSVTYYTAVLRNKTVFFEEITDPSEESVQPLISAGKCFKYNADNEDKPQGRYVPARQTIVVVDEVNNFGQYTLLVVDWVEDADEEYDKEYIKLDAEAKESYVPSYESHLKPINFTGGVDQATRAIDYNNDRLMLFVEDISDPNGQGTVQRLVPDRKLMMYGPRPLRYALRRETEDYILNTNSYLNARGGSEELGNYVTAMSKTVTIANKVDYENIVGSTVVYYDANGDKQEPTQVILERDELGEYTVETTAMYNALKACCDRGEAVTLITNSDDLLLQVQLPEPCYLRSNQVPLKSGDIVLMEIYEIDEDTSARRIVTTVNLHVRTGTSLDSADLTKGTIVGFDVLYGSDTSAKGEWPIEYGTSSSSIIGTSESRGIHPYLILEDGSRCFIDAEDSALRIFGLDILDKEDRPVAGEEFDILFKYYPYVAAGLKPTAGINTRYVPTRDEIPYSGKQYFIKTVTDEVGSVAKWSLASEDGTLEEFTEGVKYYEKQMYMSWDGVVNRPSRDFLVCKKRVVIQSGLSASNTKIRHISTIPVWDESSASWDFKFLVYRGDYNIPKLITKEPSDNGYITGADTLPYGPMSEENDDIYYTDLFYKPNKTQNAFPTSKKVFLNIQPFKAMNYATSYALKERWLIGGSGSADVTGAGWIENSMRCPYGRHSRTFQRIRPRLECWKEEINGVTVGKFQIPTTMDQGFANLTKKNWFLEQFYKAALDDSDTWAVQVEPNCFRIRAVEGNYVSVTDDQGSTTVKWFDADDISSDYFVIDEGPSSPMSYGVAFECPGIKIPTDPDIERIPIYDTDGITVVGYERALPTIVIVEFAYKANGQIMTLLGVPVEVYRIAKNPAEQ